MLNGVLHVLPASLPRSVSKWNLCDIYTFVGSKNQTTLWLCIDRTERIYIHTHRIIKLINQKFCCEKHAIWNRSAAKIYGTEGNVVKLKHVKQNETDRNWSKEEKKHTRRRLRLFELFERKEHGCTQILCLLFILVQHAVCISSSKIQRKKMKKKHKKDGERYEFNSTIIWCMFNCLEYWWLLETNTKTLRLCHIPFRIDVYWHGEEGIKWNARYKYLFMLTIWQKQWKKKPAARPCSRLNTFLLFRIPTELPSN